MDEMIAALAKKLRLTPETRLLALNAPEDYLAAWRAAGFVVSLAPISESDTYGAIHIFVRDQAEAQAALTSATAALQPGGVFWMMWPKKTSGVATDLTRDSLAALALTEGWGPVSNVSIDETWSALRLRPEAEVKRSGRGPGQ
jgi:hypothetical protein